MDFRMLASVLLNLIAFAVPLAFFVAYFGPEVRISLASTWHLSALGGSVFFAFLVALIAARLLPRQEDTLPQHIIRLLQAGATEKRASIAHERHRTERLSRAVRQLGDDNMATRLGGIYALEWLAKDSDTDHARVMDILTAYVRENAPSHAQDAPQAADTPNTPDKPNKPATDIQAILTVIGQQKTPGNKRHTARLDLNRTRLVGADLRMADLNRADLTGADLTGADLLMADLTDADLVDANLLGANLTRANLLGANLTRANLLGANLTRANLLGANLSGSKYLRAEEVQSALNWRDAHLPDHLKHLTESIDPSE